ncbi:MAG: EAL domain-containing protein [Spirochaetales bacterium]|nr:EAL domain-containing protein [Spirochaetales bacterium]
MYNIKILLLIISLALSPLNSTASLWGWEFLGGMEEFLYQGILLSALLIYGAMYFMGSKRKEYLFFALMNGGLSLWLLSGSRAFLSLFPRLGEGDGHFRLSLIGLMGALISFMVFYGWYRRKPRYKRTILSTAVVTALNIPFILFLPLSTLSSLKILLIVEIIFCFSLIVMEAIHKAKIGVFHPLGFFPGFFMVTLALLAHIFPGSTPFHELLQRLAVSVLVLQQLIYHSYLSLKSVKHIKKLNQDYVQVNRELKKSLNRIKDQTELIQFISSRDGVTGLPNRNQFPPVFEKEINSCGCQGKKNLCFALLEWDDSKTVLHRQGIQSHSEVILILAERLERFKNKDEWICRYSDDRFLLILPLCESEGASRMNELYRICRAPLQGFDEEYAPRISLGYSHYQGGTLTKEALQKQLFAALDYSKKQRLDGPCLFDRRIDIFQKEKIRLESKLKKALKRDVLEIHYQPQHDAENYRICGVEALMRWNDPDLGVMHPEEFISLAEELGLIEDIDLYTIKAVLNQMHRWQNTALSDLQVSLNISPVNFVSPDFIEDLIALTENRGIDPTRIKLELTESILVFNRSQIYHNMSRLKEKGFSIALDDFGTGYSSLAYLSDFPVDVLKIDKAFVKDILTDHRKKGIVNSIIAIGQALGMEIISEGVEREDELLYLKKAGCHTIQGYVFSPALTPEKLLEYSKTRKIYIA